MTTRAELRTTRAELRALLAQGRYALSVGRVKEAAALAKAQPRLAAHLVDLLFDQDPGVQQRAADVLERVTAHLPARAKLPSSGRPTTDAPEKAAMLERVLARDKDAILGLLIEVRPETHPKKLRWNLALMLGRFPLTITECRRAAPVLCSWLDDSSSIVKTAALQCLADMTRVDPASVPAVVDLLRIHSRSGTAAMRARCRILLKRLEHRE
jgi:HEAT repeat protein